MDYYCEFCDDITKIESKSKHLQSLSHNDFRKSIRRNHTIRNPDFIAIDEMFHEYNTFHNEKSIYISLNLISNYILMRKFYAHVKADIRYNATIFHLERFLSYCIDYLSNWNKY